MVNSILKYIEPQLKAYMTFLNRVDSPVFRISSGEMIKGSGQEKEVVTISDLNGNSLYIRQTQPETINERKALSSCDKEYNISARCKLVFYTFGGNDFTINPDKVKSKIINTLASLDFSHYSGSSTEIKIDVNGTSLDIEKIYTEETGKEFTGNVWPTLVSVDFTLSYVDTNCNTCDIDDSETVVTWTPDLTPENCETKAICEVISKCDVITLLQEQTASLQEQIDNLPQSGLTCTDLPNCQTIIDILQSINDIISGLPSSYFSCADLEFCQTIIDIVSDISALQTQVGTNTTDISTLQGQVSSLISDLGTLTTTVNNHISDTSNPHNVTLEQARSENSSISGDINANNNTIINLKDAVNPQEPITKIQFDTYVSAVGGNRGPIDCSTNPNYPASNKGDRWEVTVAGKIGGPSGINVDVYDEIVCVTASASGDQATVGVNFYIVQGNIERATETTNGYTSYATDAETQGNIENTKTITPLKLYNWFVAKIQSVFVKKGTLTTNYIPKATASDTIGDSSITDDGTTVTVNSPTVITSDNGNNQVISIDNLKALVAHDVKILFNSPIYSFANMQANEIVETDASKNLVSAAKGTAYNKNFGTTTGTVLEGDRISQTITNGVIDKAPSEDVVFDSLALKAPIASPTFTGTPLAPTASANTNNTQIATTAYVDDLKANFINKKNSDTPHTGTTSPTVIHSFEITPGTCQANDVLKFYIRHLSTNNANTKTIRIKANSINSTVGATTLATYTYTTNSGGVFPFKRSLFFKNSLTSQKIINTTQTHANDEVSYPNNGDITLALDFTASVWILIEVTLANASDTFTMNLFNCKIER